MPDSDSCLCWAIAGDPADEEGGGREQEPRECAFDEGFEILGEATGAVHSSEAALHDPALGQDDEAFGSRVGPLDHLKPDPARLEHGPGGFISSITAINESAPRS